MLYKPIKTIKPYSTQRVHFNSVGWVEFNLVGVIISTEKLDGVGFVDNRPSTHKLHHFVKKK